MHGKYFLLLLPIIFLKETACGPKNTIRILALSSSCPKPIIDLQYSYSFLSRAIESTRNVQHWIMALVGAIKIAGPKLNSLEKRR
jgi:hypothetical protein